MSFEPAKGYAVACCMPLRDPGAELVDTMRSFARCALKPYLVVVDDGSAVPVEIDFHRYGLEGVVFRFERNQGISAALNMAVAYAYAAGFRVIARMDGDDINHPARFTRQLAYLDAHPECLAVFGCADLIDEHGAPMGNRSPPTDPRDLRRAMALNNVLIHPTAALRREYVARFGLYSDDFPNAEDYEYFLRGVMGGVVHVMPDRLIRYRLRQGSVTFSRYRQQLASRLRIQVRYLPHFGARGWLGIARTLMLLLAGGVLPLRALGALRRRLLSAAPPPASAGIAGAQKQSPGR